MPEPTPAPAPTTDASASVSAAAAPATDIWHRFGWLALALGLGLGLELRLNLLESEGLRGDLDQFVGWVHHIATQGLADLYSGTDAGPVTFGPVMAYVWSVLAAIEPAFQTVTDASDPAIRALMKTPASIADFGLALLVAFALRRDPRIAVLAALAVLLHPAVIDVSAWWGQYESIFVLSGLAALIAATRSHNGWAAAFLAVSLATKPQAIPFLIPFAAWFWASGGWREVARAAGIGLAVTVVLWLPFIPAGGPMGYLQNLATYQNEIFNVLSLRAWNPWWLLQTFAAGGDFIADDVAFLGPFTLRHVGYVVTGALSLVIGWAIIRDPRPRTLILGLAASVLAFFTFMTQMHERYAYAAVIFLVLLFAEPRSRWLWLALSVVFTLNLLSAIPPTPEIEELLPVAGPIGIVGSVVMTILTVVAIMLVRDRVGPSDDRRATEASIPSAG